MNATTPETTEQALGAVADLVAHGTEATIRGSGTWSNAHDTGVVLNTAGMTGIVEHMPDDLTVVVRAGTTLGELDAVLSSENQSAVLPEMTLDRTIGGVVASGDSGYRRLRYGPTRDRVLGATMVTGYGEVVHGGGRLVKNVTGYDLPRLVTGSMGALGVITEVCLKLWPIKPVTATVAIGDASEALGTLYQPLAILETDAGTRAYLEGTEEAVATSAASVGGELQPGLEWPTPIESPVVVSVRVPAARLVDAIRTVRDAGPDRFVAQHGVGIVEVGFTSLNAESLEDLRASLASVGAVVVVVRWPDGTDVPDRWGTDHQATVIARNLKSLFDPAGAVNPGVLPGGI